MDALVTGGSGFLGMYLVAALRAAGKSVRVLDVNVPADRPADVELVQGDIREPGVVARAVAGVTCVYHAVATVPLAKDRAAFWSVNQGGTAAVLEAALQAGVAKVVHISSSAVFGVPAANPVTEETPVSPAEEYGRAKAAAEEVCLAYATRGLDVSIIRPRTIMGPGRMGIMQILFEWVREGVNVPVLGAGDNRYQFIHAADLVDACLAAARPGARLYNLGAERFGTMRETLEGLVKHAGTGSRVRSVPMGLAVAGMNLTSALGLSPLGGYHALMYGRALWFDIGRAQTELGFAPRYSNVEMFCETYDWYVRERETVLGSKNLSSHRSPVAQGALRLLRWFI